MERITIVGRLTDNAVLKETEKSIFTVFNVAVDTDKLDAEGKSIAKFFSVINFYKETPKNVHLFTKGSVVSVEGKVEINSYIDKNNEKQFSLQIVANHAKVEHIQQVKVEATTENN